MVFRKRTIIMGNKDDHETWVLTQICIAYSLILTYRWHVKFDVNVFNNINTNVTILHFKTDIAYTYCKQLTGTLLSIYPLPFLGIPLYMNNPETSVLVNFEIDVDTSW